MKRMIKRLLCLALVGAMAMGLTACGGSNTASGANRLEQIKERGYIEVATEPYFAPNEFIDSTKTGDDKYVGADIELARKIADHIGVELRLVPLEFGAVLSSVTEGKYDLAISALGYTPERAEAMDLSNGYYINPNSKGYGFLVREEDKDKYSSMEDFKGKTIACQSGSMQETFVNTQMEGLKEVVRASSSNDVYLMVAEGKVDAAACFISSADLYAEANGGLITLETVKFYRDPQYDGTRVGIPKGETELLNAVNEVIDEVTASGEYDQWYEEYTEYARTLGVD